MSDRVLRKRKHQAGRESPTAAAKNNKKAKVRHHGHSRSQQAQPHASEVIAHHSVAVTAAHVLHPSTEAVDAVTIAPAALRLLCSTSPFDLEGFPSIIVSFLDHAEMAALGMALGKEGGACLRKQGYLFSTSITRTLCKDKRKHVMRLEPRVGAGGVCHGRMYYLSAHAGPLTHTPATSASRGHIGFVTYVHGVKQGSAQIPLEVNAQFPAGRLLMVGVMDQGQWHGSVTLFRTCSMRYGEVASVVEYDHGKVRTSVKIKPSEKNPLRNRQHALERVSTLEIMQRVAVTAEQTAHTLGATEEAAPMVARIIAATACDVVRTHLQPMFRSWRRMDRAQMCIVAASTSAAGMLAGTMDLVAASAAPATAAPAVIAPAVAAPVLAAAAAASTVAAPAVAAAAIVAAPQPMTTTAAAVVVVNVAASLANAFHLQMASHVATYKINDAIHVSAYFEAWARHFASRPDVMLAANQTAHIYQMNMMHNQALMAIAALQAEVDQQEAEQQAQQQVQQQQAGEPIDALHRWQAHDTALAHSVAHDLMSD
jgi:hypothetical protein